MKILLDESLPRKLKQELSEHQTLTVPEMGWAGRTNGELLALARNEFDAFLTVDQNLEHQQNLIESHIPVIVLVAPSNRFGDLRTLIPGVLASLKDLGPGQIVRIGR